MKTLHNHSVTHNTQCTDRIENVQKCKLKWAGIAPATNCIQLKLVFSMLGGKNLVQQIRPCRASSICCESCYKVRPGKLEHGITWNVAFS